jgi:diacylglycerol kinase (ATP)
MVGTFCLVVNPAAGGGRSPRALPAVTAALDVARAPYQVCVSANLDQAREIAARATRLGHAVVAVGGDGLAGALAGVVAAQGAGLGAAGSFGVIPTGRGNDLARTLGIPLQPARAAEVLTAGAPRLVDLLCVAAGDGHETIAAGSAYAGLPAVAGQLANQTPWLRGPTAYRAAALRALARWTPVRFLAEARLGAAAATTVRFAGYAVVVANAAYFGAGMKVAPAAEIDDGQLDVVIMRHGSRLAFLRALARASDGRHVTLPEVSVDRCTEITITADPDTQAAADGEALAGGSPLRAGTPLRIRVLPGALRVLGPAAGAARRGGGD